MLLLVQVLLKLIQPYTRVRLPFISQALHIPEADVEQLLVSLILDNRIQGHVDQVGGSGGRGGGSGRPGPENWWSQLCQIAAEQQLHVIMNIIRQAER